MKKILLIIGFLVVLIILLLVVYRLTSSNTYNLGEYVIAIPREYNVIQSTSNKHLTGQNYYPTHEYCAVWNSDSRIDCDLLIVEHPSATEESYREGTRYPFFVLSYPGSFGLLRPPIECKVEEHETIFTDIEVFWFYKDPQAIQYRPELIDEGAKYGPYDCSLVDINDENFEFLTGCNNAGLCVWGNKDFGTNDIKELINSIEIDGV